MRGSYGWAVVAAVSVVAAAVVLAGSPSPAPSRHVAARDVGRDALLRLSPTGALPGVRAPSGEAATWCGKATQEDRVPNVMAGNPVHWIYAVPSDGADRTSSEASAMQADAELIDTWWRGQDPTRTLRDDLAQFPCGAQLDISTVRLGATGAVLDGDSRFERIVDAVSALGFRSSFAKYLVYYDGPVSEQNLCGQGGSDGTGFGVAVVYVRSCSGIAPSLVAAHEVLHTLGAVPDGAPHNCPSPNDGHTCDDTRDIMYPFVDQVPLSSEVLDAGRDDYYGHSGAWLDVQDSAWLVQLDRQTPFELGVSGPGSVSADVPGLLCAESCTTTWNAGTVLALSATPDPGAKLVRWAGACGGSRACRVTVAPGTTASALFAPATYRLAVSVAGGGVVRSSSRGISCRPRCSAPFPSYVPLRLRATPVTGWRFVRWQGACRGTRPSCTVPMRANASARAVFAKR